MFDTAPTAAPAAHMLMSRFRHRTSTLGETGYTGASSRWLNRNEVDDADAAEWLQLRPSLENKNMTKFGKYFSALLMAFALTSMVGCAATSKQESTGEYVDDSMITAKVKAKILDEPTLKVAEINVETFKGVVQLSGFVASQASANRAVEVARSVSGVKSVKNDMRVK